jgi:protocatechuate 3,4-dioxygenase beta subunit
MKTRLSIVVLTLLASLCYPAEEVQTVTVTGCVADYQGRPVAEATVVCYDLTAKLGQRNYEPVERAQTTPDGRFSLQVETRGPYPLLVAGKQDLALAWMTIERAGGCTIRLGRPNLFKGTVVDEAGRPVPGAKVRMCLKNEMMARTEIAPLVPESWFTTQTDTRGQFSFDNIPEGTTADFGVAASGRSPMWTFCDFGLEEGEHYAAGQTDIRITLPAEARIEGCVVDEGTGDPVSGLRVLARPYGRPGWDYCQEPAATDPNGRFVLARLTPGAYLLEVVLYEGQVQDWFSTNPVVTVGPAQVARDVRLNVNKAATLEVIVRDLAGGAALEGARVNVSCDRFEQIAMTDPNGLVRLHVPPGKCTISGFKPGHSGLRNARTLELTKGQVHREELRFDCRAVRVSGTALDPQGRVLSEAFVAHLPMLSASTYADANGRFEYTYYYSSPTGVLPSRELVLVRHHTSGLANIVELQDPSRSGRFEGRIQLKPAYWLTGRVTDPGGVGIPAAYVRLLKVDSNGSYVKPNGDRIPWRDQIPVAEVVTDANGVYHIPGVPMLQSDYYYVVAVHSAGFNESSLSPVPLAGPVEQPIHLETLILKRPDQTTSGVVLDANDKPVPGALVETPSFDWRDDNTQPHRRVLSDTHGRFHIDGVCKGPLQISALSPPPNGQKGVTHTFGGEKRVKIVLGKTLTFAKSLAGTGLPSWEELGLADSWTGLDNKAILLCLVDIEQRPCRHFLKQLAQRTEELARHNVAVRTVQAAKCAPAELEKWAGEFGPGLPVAVITSNPEGMRLALGIQSLPWLILTDRRHIVRAEGFGLDVLSQKITDIARKED